jgi:hypothetical protein
MKIIGSDVIKKPYYSSDGYLSWVKKIMDFQYILLNITQIQVFVINTTVICK